MKRTFFTSLFLFTLLLFSPPLLAEGPPQKGLSEICVQKTNELEKLESTMSEEHKILRFNTVSLKEVREGMDGTRKLWMEAELGNIPKEWWGRIQKGRDKPLPKEEVIEIFKKSVEMSLNRFVEDVERYKKFVEETNAAISKLTKEIGQVRGEMAKAGCKLPLEKTWALPELEPEKKPVPQPQATSPFQLFLGDWKGTAKITKSSDPKYVGLSSPYSLSVVRKENGLVLTDSNGVMGDPAAYKIKAEGASLRIDYSGPPSLQVPQVTTTLTFTLLLRTEGDKLTGTASTATRSVYEGPAGKGSSDYFAEIALHLERAKQ